MVPKEICDLFAVGAMFMNTRLKEKKKILDMQNSSRL